MGKQISGPIFSGRIGDKVYLKNGVIRSYVDPSKPPTSKQSALRALFAFLMTLWHALTAEGQLAWNLSAEQWSFPAGIKRSGMNLFNMLNKNLQLTLQVLIDEPPVQDTVPSSVLSVSMVGPVLTWDNTLKPVGVTSKLRATIVQSLGTTKPQKKMYRDLTIDAVGAANDITAAYLLLIGSALPPAVGSGKTFFEMYHVDATGQRSATTRTTIVW